MIARFSDNQHHCDRHTLESFALDQLGNEQAGVAEHIEACAECQNRLETLSCGDLTWDEIGGLLRESDTDCHAEAFCYPPTDAAEDAYDKKTVVNFLQPSDRPDAIGRFARYEIMELLGRGGMGIVMRGFDPSLERHCAIKVLAPELASSGSARRRFSREAKSAAAVVHPHVVPIQNVDEHEGLPYLVMPVIEGESLQRRVEQAGPLETIEVARIAAQVADGLAAAHGQGLVHRDIKPANILLEKGVERVQITDFGLARAIDDASMTHSGVIAGTPQYMSPEQAHGDTIDHRSDLFSLGSLMYFMLTGRSPFRAETTMGVLNRISNDSPKPIREINADVPVWLEQFVLRLLSKSPDDRFQTSTEVAELLESCLAHLQKPITHPLPATVASVDSSQSGHRGIPGLITAVAFFSLAAAAVLVLTETNKGTIRIESDADEIPVVIRKQGEIYDKLTVGRDGIVVRVRAGEYEIDFDGEYNQCSIDNGVINLQRGKESIVRIRELGPETSVAGVSPNEHYEIGTETPASERSLVGKPDIVKLSNDHLRLSELEEIVRVIPKEKTEYKVAVPTPTQVLAKLEKKPQPTVATPRPDEVWPYPMASNRRSTATRSDRTFMWFFSQEHIHFLFYHQGVLQQGLEYKEYFDTQHSAQLWKFRGSIDANSGKRTVVDGQTDRQPTRRFDLAFGYDPPELMLKLDAKTYDLAEGRVFVLPPTGTHVQLDVDLPETSEMDQESALDRLEEKIHIALASQWIGSWEVSSELNRLLGFNDGSRDNAQFDHPVSFRISLDKVAGENMAASDFAMYPLLQRMGHRVIGTGKWETTFDVDPGIETACFITQCDASTFLWVRAPYILVFGGRVSFMKGSDAEHDVMVVDFNVDAKHHTPDTVAYKRKAN